MDQDHRVQAWFHSLRDAIGARDEPLYRERVAQFLITAEGVSFVQRNLDTPAARGVMAVAYERLMPVLGLTSPADLLARMIELKDVDANDEHTSESSMASTFMHYLRLGRAWARACQIDLSFGVALAMLLFEPLLVLFEDAGGIGAADPVSVTAQPVSSSASMQRGVQFA